ncbi:response regulator [Algicella marina]|uniref:Response regulator n=1 Tax=Algicella marina TaxID=2683284 RepID=A0A6P1SZA6_9RHOB|nr:response regulator [Algicella marina]QHQ34855.1 response regulator [Algicella marina]
MLGQESMVYADSDANNAEPLPLQTCLLIDDSRYDRQIIKRLARSAGLGLKFLELSNLQSARALIQTEPIDLVIADQNLPDGTGLEFAREILSGKLGIGVPLILMTGHGCEKTVADAFDAGCMGYMSKWDLSEDTLKRTVSRSFSDFANGYRISVSAVRRAYGPKTPPAASCSDLISNLHPHQKKLMRQIRGLRVDVQSGNSLATLAQIDLLEETLAAMNDTCALFLKRSGA